MATGRNFLLGFGERLVERVPPPPIKPSKAHPYTFAEARERLLPRMDTAAKQIAALPAQACPDDQAVVMVTLHPAYLAKSYFPDLTNCYRRGGIASAGMSKAMLRGSSPPVGPKMVLPVRLFRLAMA